MGEDMNELINIGCTSYISIDKLVAVVAPDAAPIRRMILSAKNMGKLIDATCGRKTKSVLCMDSDHIILSCLSVETIETKVKDCVGG